MKREADEGRTRCHELQHWDQGKLKMEPAQSPQAKEREAKLVPDATRGGEGRARCHQLPPTPRGTLTAKTGPDSSGSRRWHCEKRAGGPRPDTRLRAARANTSSCPSHGEQVQQASRYSTRVGRRRWSPISSAIRRCTARSERRSWSPSLSVTKLGTACAIRTSRGSKLSVIRQMGRRLGHHPARSGRWH